MTTMTPDVGRLLGPPTYVHGDDFVEGWSCTCHEQFATRDEAIATGPDCLGMNVDAGDTTFKTARLERREGSVAFATSAELVLDDIMEYLGERYNEDVLDRFELALGRRRPDRLRRLTDLQERLNKVVTEWADKHGLTPEVWSLHDVEDHVIDAGTVTP